MDRTEVNNGIASGEIDTVVLASPDMQGRAFAKRLTADYYRSRRGAGVSTCSVVLGWGHDHSLDDGYQFTGWDTGYPDLMVQPDEDTLSLYPWADRTAFVIGDAVTPNGEQVDIAPRSILKAALARLASHGLHAQCASELECYLLSETPLTAFDKGFVNLQLKHRTLHPETLLRTSEDEAFLGPLRRSLAAAGIAVEMVKAEYAPGQIEVNLEYAPALIAADRHFLFKLGTKEEALKQGLLATFMAKPWQELGGSSCHIHLSLVDNDGRNVFDDSGSSSATMQHFLGGLTKYMQDIFLFLAPTINSYKRLQPNTFAPASITWGEDNRTAALRLIGSGPSRRIENRIPGADINPYLAYAGMIAAGLRGIEEKAEPTVPSSDGNAYAGGGGTPLPTSLLAAAETFGQSGFIRETFGEATQQHYTNFGLQSVAAAARIVTDYERRILLMDI